MRCDKFDLTCYKNNIYYNSILAACLSLILPNNKNSKENSFTWKASPLYSMKPNHESEGLIIFLFKYQFLTLELKGFKLAGWKAGGQQATGLL